MTNNLTITKTPPKQPGMNYDLLCKEGIKNLERLGSGNWTDYNTHDPGITILEQLCYAITDLSYRLNFDIKDILTPNSEDLSEKKQFFTGREILPINPLTINDYRKLLIDIPGVKNAWLEVIKHHEPSINYDTVRHELTYQDTENTKEVIINGLYRILVHIEEGYELESKQIMEKVAAYRNVCEDFSEILILPHEEIILDAMVVIEEEADPDGIMANIWHEVHNYISPLLSRYTYEELIIKGRSVEKIFTGPFLENGFIDDADLDKHQKRTQLFTSNIIQVIFAIEGVKKTKEISIKNNQDVRSDWVLDLDNESTPVLQKIEDVLENRSIKIYKGGTECQLNKERVKEQLNELIRQKKKLIANFKKDIPVQIGEYRELFDYESIQEEFPANYGIGQSGLSESASQERKAMAKQLKAYLNIFDSILANYHVRLDSAKRLLSVNNKDFETNSKQMVPTILETKDVFSIDRNEQSKINEHKNRLMNHLLGRFNETFLDKTLLAYTELNNKYLKMKSDYLSEYPELSSNRSKSFNYKDKTKIWNTDNVSGLKVRIGKKLAISDNKRISLADGDKEGFHIVEQILFRPYEKTQNKTTYFVFHKPILSVSKSQISNNMCTFTSLNHGLLNSDTIKIFDTINYNGEYSVAYISDNTFDIKLPFESTETGKWVKADHSIDPYSFQLSFVLPDWPERFKDSKFKQTIMETILLETPTHIKPSIYWFNREKMKTFEIYYKQWLGKLANDTSDVQLAANKLMELLNIGRPYYTSPVLNGLVQHMTGDSYQAGKWIDFSRKNNNPVPQEGIELPTQFEVTNQAGKTFKVMRFEKNQGMTWVDTLNIKKPYTVIIIDRYYGQLKGTTLHNREQVKIWGLGKKDGKNYCQIDKWKKEENAVDNQFNINMVIATEKETEKPKWYLDNTLKAEADFSIDPGKLAICKSGKTNDYSSEADVAAIMIYDRALEEKELKVLEEFFNAQY